MHSQREEVARSERKLLAALCQGSLPQQIREQIRLRLAQHLASDSFAVAENEILFRAVSELPSSTFSRSSFRDVASIREVLLLKVTRMGFPDTDVEAFFVIAPASEDDIPRLFDDLLDEKPPAGGATARTP